VKLVSRAGWILAAWIAALGLEHLIIGLGYRRFFSGPWEMGAARTALTPLAIAVLVPAAVLFCAFYDATALRKRWPAFACGIFAGGVAFGVSSGRHMANLGIRIPFVCISAALAIGLGAWLLPRLLDAARDSLRFRLIVFASLGAIWWSADAFVLPRLYPAFHHGAFVVALAAFGVIGWASVSEEKTSRIGIAVLVLGLLGAAWVPFGMKRMQTMDNLRLVLVDRAPFLGRSVRLASIVWPPAQIQGESKTFGEITRSLDWTGHDIVLVSIDALRADHVGAYGYGRKTTPRIDALAAEGAVFDAAYCATPHTSYSITSMLTGKYVRPLFSLGLGEDSQTLASYLRTYGYRTAAFYPPAVFFIDQHKFQAFEQRALDFEYRKVEFAGPALRREQITAYLGGPDAEGKPLFLWVHFFEPHEPYIEHPEHVFGTKEIDAYDSEIATADDGVGIVVDAVRAKRPGAIVIVTADHGEEFGEHGGRYHGTTVYEEQVRVPLVVVGPGVVHGRIAVPAQTIDVVPTVLSALGVPRPARVRGRDLGPLLAGKGSADDPGFAFAETDDQTLVAEHDLRLVCARRAGACSLFDVKADPVELHDVSADHLGDAQRLKGILVATARDHGKYEGQGSTLPEALRRGMQGDVDADVDVAALLDDANVDVRRRAASVLFDLGSPRVSAQLRRALEKDEDDTVKRWTKLALVRIGEPAKGADALLSDPDVQWRRAAAMAFAEHGDHRGESELVSYWALEGPPKGSLDFVRARDLLRLLGSLQAKAAVPSLLVSLEDIRLRPFVADALGAIGDPSARKELLRALSEEKYATARTREALALVKLGEKEGLRAPLASFVVQADPMVEAIGIARDAGLLGSKFGGWSAAKAAASANGSVDAPAGPSRLVVLLGEAGSDAVTAKVGDRVLTVPTRSDAVRFVDFDSVGKRVDVEIGCPRGVLAFWLVQR
jgi:hypothetical protein